MSWTLNKLMQMLSQQQHIINSQLYTPIAFILQYIDIDVYIFNFEFIQYVAGLQ